MVAELVQTEAPLAFLDELKRALDAADPTAYLDQSPVQARRTAMRIQRLQARLAAHSAAAVRAVDALVPVGTAGSTGTADLLARDFGGDRRAAGHQVRLAEALGERTATEQALADGLITEWQAALIVNTLRGVPAEHRDRCEQTLIAAAQTLSAKDLTRRAKRIADVYTPKPEVDRVENEALQAQERRAWERTALWMADQRDGTWRGAFVLPDLQAELLRTMLDAVTAPRQAEGRFDKLNDRSAPQATSVPEPVEGTLNQRTGHAFCHLIEKMPVDGLRDGLAAATIATGTRLSAGETRRLACSAGIIPAVLDGDGLPLDLGRTRRLFTKHQKTAIGLRDLGCVAPGKGTVARGA